MESRHIKRVCNRVNPRISKDNFPVETLGNVLANPRCVRLTTAKDNAPDGLCGAFTTVFVRLPKAHITSNLVTKRRNKRGKHGKKLPLAIPLRKSVFSFQRFRIWKRNGERFCYRVGKRFSSNGDRGGKIHNAPAHDKDACFSRPDVCNEHRSTIFFWNQRVGKRVRLQFKRKRGEPGPTHKLRILLGFDFGQSGDTHVPKFRIVGKWAGGCRVVKHSVSPGNRDKLFKPKLYRPAKLLAKNTGNLRAKKISELFRSEE